VRAAGRCRPPRREQHARIGEFVDQPVDAEQHEDVGDAGVADHCQQAAAPVGSDFLDGRTGGVEGQRLAVKLDDAAVELLQQVIEVGRHQVDHLQFQCLGCRQTHRLAHRALGPFDIAAAQFGQPRI